MRFSQSDPGRPPSSRICKPWCVLLGSGQATGATSIKAGGLEVEAGGLNVRSGGATVSSGGLAVDGGIVLRSGTLVIEGDGGGDGSGGDGGFEVMTLRRR